LELREVKDAFRLFRPQNRRLGFRERKPAFKKHLSSRPWGWDGFCVFRRREELMFNFDKAFKTILIDYNFQPPIAWVWVGRNGAFLFGKIIWEGKEYKSVTLGGKPKKLRFPVNVMLVDAKGMAAHLLLKETGEIDGANRCRVEEPPPAISPNWPNGCGKA
jgi:hypothetical protein